MLATVFIYLARIVFGKEAFEMLVRLYAGEIILGKFQLENVPKGLYKRVYDYLVDMGYIEPEAPEAE